MKYTKTQLNNGLSIVTSPMPSMESVGVGVWVNAGSRFEDKNSSGVSHFIEHLLFKGTDKRSSEDIKRAIEGIGGSLNAFTAEEFTCYLAKVPKKYVTLAIDVLSDMVLHPRLDNKDIEKERLVILEEIKMYQDMPQHHKFDILDELMWPDQPLGRPILGNFQTIGGIRPQDLMQFKEHFHAPNNITVILCGDISNKAVAQYLNKIYSARLPRVVTTFSRAVIKQENPKVRIVCKKTEQSHFAIGMHSFGRKHPDRFILTLLHVILGANMSSRLFQEVREKRGLAYDISTSVRRFKDAGAFVVSAGVDNNKVTDTVSVVMNELSKLKKNFVSADELNRAKEFYKGQFAMSLEDTLERMVWIGEQEVTLRKIYARQEIIDSIDKVTPEDIKRVAKDIFDKNLCNVSLISPTKGSLKEKTILSILNNL